MTGSKVFLSLVAIVLLQSNITSAQSTRWNLDKSHSSIGFSVDHLMISETVGEFKDYKLEVSSDKADFSDAKFSLTIQVQSVNTNDEKRDEHLRGADFFDVNNFPTIEFIGKKFTKVSANEYKVTGEIKMHGVTKTITLNAKFGAPVKDPWGGTRAGIKVWGELDRYAFDLKYNATLEAGGLAIGKIVTINCNIELIKG